MIQIQIVKWRNYVSRNDLKNIPWLRINEKIVFDHRIYSLTSDQKWAWIFLLTEAARQNDFGSIRIDPNSLATLARVPINCLDELLKHLEKNELIEIGESSEKLPANSSTDNVVSEIESVPTQHNLTLPDTTAHNPKRGRRKRQPTPPDEIYDLSETELSLGRKWLEMALSEMPHKSKDPKWHAAQFAEDLKVVAKAIGYTHEQLVEVFHFVASSEFWRPNACSPKQLLKKNEAGMRKIDTIISRMKSPKERARDIKEEQEADPTRPRGEGLMSRQELEELFGRKWNE